MVRLRQVALVAGALEPAAAALREQLRLGDPYHDPGVGEFGLDNAVFEIGDTFLEVVAPVRDGTTAGRYLAKRGGDGGYMAIFEVPDTEAARDRARRLGLRAVWQIDLDDISGTHLHPKDVPGAIVSFDTPRPAGTWRWAGPAWTGKIPPHGEGGIAGVTVECAEPERAAATWAALLDASAEGSSVPLDGGRQRVTFCDAGARGDGIAEVLIAGLDRPRRVCGVTFRPPGPA